MDLSRLKEIKKSTADCRGPKDARTEVLLTVAVVLTDTFETTEDVEVQAQDESGVLRFEEDGKTAIMRMVSMPVTKNVERSWPHYLNGKDLERWNAGGSERDAVVYESVLKCFSDACAECDKEKAKCEAPAEQEELKTPAPDDVAGYRESVAEKRKALQEVVDAGEAAKAELAQLPATP